MRSIAPNLVMIAIGTLTLLAAVVLFRDAAPTRHRVEISEDFHRLVGGLGFGPVLDLSQGSGSFDPRLDGEWLDANERLDSPAQFGPLNPLSIFHYSPLRRSSFVIRTEE
jgi:hypothetical protein